jgi:PIN domain nuclease of toxin-antitoxin system
MEAVLLVATLDASHANPFDRVLAAQAIQLDIALVTCDVAFSSFSGLTTVW